MNRGKVGTTGRARIIAGLVVVVGLLAAPLAVGADERGADVRGRASTSAAGFPPASGPPHDDFGDAQLLTGASGFTPGSNEGATLELDEPIVLEEYELDASVWFQWVAPADGTVTFTTQGSSFDTVLASYEGSELAALSLVEENDQAFGTDQSSITFAVEQEEVYRIQLAGYHGSEGGYGLEWYMADEPVTNDAFLRSRFIGGLQGRYVGTTAGATFEDGEPSHDGAGPGSSVWFSAIAAVDGTITYEVEPDGFDAVVAIYTGTAIDALTEVDSGEGSASIEVEPGDDHRIVVDGVTGGDVGPYELSWSTEVDVPANDDFADAEVLSGTDPIDGHNIGATAEVDEPEHAGEPAEHSIWFRWTPDSSGPVSIDTFDSDFDTLLAVYTGSSLGSLSEVAANDQWGDTAQSKVSFVAEAGTTYQIAVDGWDGEEGLVRLDAGPVQPSFDDVGTGHPFFFEIQWMDELGVSTGYPDDTYRPAAPVTRQAMSAFLYRLAGILGLDEVELPATPTFDDVGTTHPFFLEVEWMAATGISAGYPDGTFKPAAPVTRQAMSAFLHRAHDVRFDLPPGSFVPPETPTFDDVGTGHPFYVDVEWMADAGISEGYPDRTFKPAAPVTRQAMSAFLYRLWFVCTCGEP
jgi:hypothetical protein